MPKKSESTRLQKCRTFVKKLLPTAVGRKREHLPVWDIFPHPHASSLLDYGFTLEEAWFEAATRLGMPPIVVKKKPEKLEWWQVSIAHY